MTKDIQNKSDSTDEQIRQLQKERNRLQRKVKRYETQLPQLDKMASANEKININLNNELDALAKELEAKNKALEVETALERVRTRAMAMQSSDDLASAIAVVFQELDRLGVTTIRCGVTIMDATAKTMQTWIATTTERGQEVQVPGLLHVAGNRTLEKVLNTWKKGAPFMSYELAGEDLKRYYRSIAAELPLPEREAYRKKQVVSLFFFPEGALYAYTPEPLSDEASQIFHRFTRVFALTYRRFLDLKQAEEQAREAQIEAALERVRARTMAMQKSDELKEVIQLIYDQFVQLGIFIEHTGFIMDYKAREDMYIWLADQNGAPAQVTIPYFDSPHWNSFNEAKQKGKDFFANHLTFAEKNRFYKKLFKHIPGLPEEAKGFYLGCPGLAISTVLLEDVGLYIENFSGIPYSDEENQTLMRFGKVFQQTYTRFLDLQKAEAQAREAQIETALERIRNRTLLMQDSGELNEAVAVFFQEFKSLDLLPAEARTYFCHIDPGTHTAEVWMTHADGTVMQGSHVTPLDQSPSLKKYYQAWKRKQPIHVRNYSGEALQEYLQFVSTLPHVKSDKDYRRLFRSPPERIVMTDANFLQGNIGIMTFEPLSEEALKILVRFAKVFEFTYTRFLDLQKAEAQAREAEIQLALERVRARSMAMHKSEELADLSLELVKQVHALGVATWFCAFNIYDDHPEGSLEWGSNGQGTFPQYRTPREGIFLDYYEAGQRGETLLINEIGEEECPAHYDYLCSLPGVGEQLLKIRDAGIPFPTSQIDHVAYFKYGYIIFITFEPAPEAHDIFKRFAKVFEQTYTRFLDLQKAEAQAREAQIEAALERVRSRTMAMQHSAELGDVAAELFAQMNQLVTNLWTCGFVLCEKDRAEDEWWLSMDAGFTRGFFLPNVGDYTHATLYEGWLKGDPFRTVQLEGEELQKHYEWLMGISVSRKIFEEMEAAGLERPDWQKLHAAYFSKGYLVLITREPCSEEEIFKRFAQVFDLIYTRFLDLKKAESQAIEATKQASLDRVRGEIASMRSAKDLEIITPLVWNELTTLGIPFIRCGVFIIHEEAEQVEVYLSKPDGTSLAVMHLPFGASDLANQIVEAWQKGTPYTQHWSKEDFLSWGRSMVEQGQIPDLESYQGAGEAPESLHLHFLPFTQGMLYVGATEPLSAGEIDLAASLAEAFAIAYARYDDFVKLETAKENIEAALAELKATQSQLVQQEKLASLGQLTAGIAHEIKNPLNFVNNFSEVSLELVEEAREELSALSARLSEKAGANAKAGDVSQLDEVLAIVDDIEANLKTIHKHGSRADNIVKSMLQHSRGSNGKMESTPINPLVKEFVNLAYHGMRAGQAPIDAEIDYQLDENVGEVPLIAEDFSRVILNLCGNAFDAMRTRSAERQAQGDYKPKLTVRTKSDGDKIWVEVEDNGPGIPEAIKDKILQPFFTTKKGTEGTGLGLSITNDIIKAHGGRIEIESLPGERTTFTIHLKKRK